eukprot:3168314-Amphidinium_carterae.1
MINLSKSHSQFLLEKLISEPFKPWQVLWVALWPLRASGLTFIADRCSRVLSSVLPRQSTNV